MKNLTNWLTKNGYDYTVNSLHQGGNCVFINIFELPKTLESNIYKHLKRIKLSFQYAGHYTSIRIDFKPA
jgi:hypothetical protein